MAAMTSGQRTMITIHFCVQWESQKSESMLSKNKGDFQCYSLS
jgi:hypothetical protein